MSHPPPASDRFADGIGPRSLLAWIANTAPFLAAAEWTARTPGTPTAAHPFGWLALIRAGAALPAMPRPDPAQRLAYFGLCLACHHASVATYIPTDVDARIRGHAWQDSAAAVIAGALALALDAQTHWDIASISARTVATPHGLVSGHHGELLGVLAGALGGCLAHGDEIGAQRAVAAIDGELEREATAFAALRRIPGGELDLLRLAAVMTHNAGDLDQGLSYWPPALATADPGGHRLRLARLSHEGAQRFAGAFAHANRLYQVIAAEGHRHYPLRSVAALRVSAELLLPLGPCLDDWGRRLAVHPALTRSGRAGVFAALVDGCRKVPGQQGYQRAIAGMAESTSLDALARDLPGAARRALDDATLRRQIAVPQASFEASLRKRAQAALG